MSVQSRTWMVFPGSHSPALLSFELTCTAFARVNCFVRFRNRIVEALLRCNYSYHFTQVITADMGNHLVRMPHKPFYSQLCWRHIPKSVAAGIPAKYQLLFILPIMNG